MVSAFNNPGFSIADPNRTKSDGVEKNAPAPARQELCGRAPFRTPNSVRMDARGM